MTDQLVEPQSGGLGLGVWDGPEPEEPTDAELFGLWPDPFAGPPDEDDAVLAALSGPELDRGFACGAPLDVLPPDETLAGFAARAFDRGLGGLSDDELVGLLRASRRLTSWQAAMELGVVAELDGRRRTSAQRPQSSRFGEEVSAELAAALTLTGRSADALLCLARDLGRLPMVFAALFGGRIDRAKAAVFAEELSAVSETIALAIAMATCRAAERMTTGQLRAELRALVLMFEPDAVRRRAERGRDQARVETWQEGSGNWGIAGRELTAADAITADARLTAIARALKDAGAEGNLDQLRAAVFVALLAGRDPQTLTPPRPGAPPRPPARTSGCGCAGGVAGLCGSINLTMPVATWLGSSDAPGEVAGIGPVDAATCRDLASRLTNGPATQWCVTLTGTDRRAAAHACARAGPAAQAERAARAGPRGSPSGGPDRSQDAVTSWLDSLRFEWLERGDCGHRRQGQGYQPGRRLRHLIQIRHRTCAHPGCGRPAEHCDLDHTLAYDQGGITCECNLAPFCRRHHQVKQALGWHATQPQPGTLIWTTPHDRRYTVRPGMYPA
jgi:hypothetical protein